MVAGSSGSAKLNSAAGYIIETQDFTITEDDNTIMLTYLDDNIGAYALANISEFILYIYKYL